MEPSSHAVDFAIEAVRQAARLVHRVQAELGPAGLTKGDRSPVTVADFASQALVGSLLATHFPADPLVAEEDAQALRSPDGKSILEQVERFVTQSLPGASPEAICQWIDRGAAAPARRFWTLDPIDGTKGFLRGDQYAVALALIVAGRVEVGVLGCPNLDMTCRPDTSGPGVLAIAVRGQGAWVVPIEGEAPSTPPLAVSHRQDPSQARLLRSYEAGHTNTRQIDAFTRVLGVRAEPVRMDSQAKYAVLASGGGDLLLRLLSPARPHYRERIWDQAAGALILEEAGGRITDLSGRPLDFTAGRTLARNRGVLASNGSLHSAALEALRQLEA